jgi:hypothetical protein
LFQPNPELLQQRKRILHERRKRAEWKKEREKQKVAKRARQERILARQIADNEAKKKNKKLDGVGKKKRQLRKRECEGGEIGYGGGNSMGSSTPMGAAYDYEDGLQSSEKNPVWDSFGGEQQQQSDEQQQGEFGNLW